MLTIIRKVANFRVSQHFCRRSRGSYWRDESNTNGREPRAASAGIETVAGQSHWPLLPMKTM